ncbi:hypothetical protein PseAD21_11920 [Pseudomonas sp. AD21]|nr:hypothetical protein PseAD21_11920 [Pseudomonas sp. AD21]
MQNGSCWRLFLETPVRVPLSTEIDCFFIRLTPDFKYVWMSFHRDDVRVYPEMTKLKRKCLQLFMAERLIRKANH